MRGGGDQCALFHHYYPHFNKEWGLALIQAQKHETKPLKKLLHRALIQ